MSNEEIPTPASSKAKRSSWSDWIWPSIVGALIVKLFGFAGGLVTIGAYYWLKPKFGTWGATTASGVLGVVVSVGLTLILGNVVPAATKSAPVAESPPGTNADSAGELPHEQQQSLLSIAAREIISRYPQLDIDAASKDQSAIDFVVSKRDAYVAKGYEIDIALRMAANDYGEQIAASQQQEAAQRYTQQITNYRFSQPSVSQSPPVTNDYVKRKNEPCQAKDVMTDEEIARCRR